MKSYHGSCLCGAIRYEIRGEIDGMLNCHCSDCRKSHGAAFRSRGGVSPSDFRFLEGESLMTRYEHRPGEFRSFCSICGSNIATFFSDPAVKIGVALGSLDTELKKGPECHVFVSDKADWYEITDNLPQFAELPPD